MKTELLSKFHDRKGFDCGNEELNRFLRETARQHIVKGLSRTQVLTESNNPSKILGFYTLSICEVETGELPDRLARRLPGKIGAIRLGRLAVDLSMQDRGLGSALLGRAVTNASIAAGKIGGVGLFVDAKDDNAAAFYRKHGFESLQPDALELFLPLQTLLDTGLDATPETAGD